MRWQKKERGFSLPLLPLILAALTPYTASIPLLLTESVVPVSLPSSARDASHLFWSMVLPTPENRTTIYVIREDRLTFEEHETLRDLIGEQAHAPFALLDSDWQALESEGLLSLQLETPCHPLHIHSFTAFACNGLGPFPLHDAVSVEEKQEETPFFLSSSLFASAKGVVRRKRTLHLTPQEKDDEEHVVNEDSDEVEDDDDDDEEVTEPIQTTTKTTREKKTDSPSRKAVEKRQEESEEENEDDSKEGEAKGLQGKVSCKYRKSCYSSGRLPQQMHPKREMERDEGGKEDESEEERAKMSLNNKLKKKLRCKYRKECYETGKLPKELHPKTQEEKRYESAEDEDDHEEGSMRVKKKLRCKYRASCYENGQLPERLNPEKEVEKENDGEDEEDPRAAKLRCKYRRSCYAEEGIQETPRKETPMTLMTSKKSVEKGTPKKSVQQVAERALRRAKQMEERAAHRPLSHAIKAEKIMDAIEEKVAKKLRCKYRKSCYETGLIPETIPLWQWGGEQEDKEEDEEVPFQQMEELDRKLFCKYRKPCYATGEKPKIEEENTYSSVVEVVHNIDEGIRISPQLKCKYRKSCYETGELPSLQAKENQQEELLKKEHPHVLPTTTQGLRHFCKYRKSCYVDIANSEAGAEAVREIQRERMAEKMEHKDTKKRAKKHHALTRREMRKLERQLEKLDGQDKKMTKRGKAKMEKEAEETVKIEAKLQGVKKRENKEEKAKDKKEEDPKRQKETMKPVTAKRVQEKRKEERKDEEKIAGHHGRKPAKKVVTLQKIVEESKEEAHDDNDGNKEEEVLKRVEPSKKQPKKDVQVNPVPSVKIVAKKVEDEKDWTEEDVEPRIPPPTKKMQTVAVDDKSGEANKEEESRQKKRDFCKYRKSCYSTGERPVIEQTAASLLSSLEDYVEHEYEQVEHQHSAADTKLLCKYRKSCYEARGQRASQAPPPLKAPKQTATTHSKGKVEDSVKAKEEVRQKQTVTPSQESEEDDSKEDQEQTDTVHYREKLKRSASGSSSLDDTEKLDCKYRHSCYSGMEPRAVVEDDAGGARREEEGAAPMTSSAPSPPTRCHKYLLSCRESLGLPPKEKVPTGPSGRKLCRKKDKEQ